MDANEIRTREASSSNSWSFRNRCFRPDETRAAIRRSVSSSATRLWPCWRAWATVSLNKAGSWPMRLIWATTKRSH